ncbi:hypothetical protein EJ04DRAFT_561285 [Polyplosphaeria fusca]|uniref:Uncharacterized protein n=1 Tax=Polyplosphaeria fusca TaxID=682080 RepID=A0A9P4V6X8_9PLEO|nr:hypothetical protein EJ04DRAFT_561285 [Polyplosphaeria fusca]
MSVALNRKRSRLALEAEEEEDEHEDTTPTATQHIAVSRPPDATLKRSKTDSDLDELSIVAPDQAWSIDVATILASPTLHSPPGSAVQEHNNVQRYAAGSSIVVFCIQGNLQLHYDLLCTALPDLYAVAPTLQALVLCRDPSSHVPSTASPFCLPLIQAVAPEYNHFVKLGLSHPLGGGHLPLDALVVVDPKGRRRLVLPFGWGAGRHAANVGGGRMVQQRLMGLLKQCIELISKE